MSGFGPNRTTHACNSLPLSGHSISLAPTSDGDGAMLGLVLVYAAILVVAVATILWKTLA